MSPTPAELLNAVLQLPIDSRAAFVEQILDSLPEGNIEADEDQLGGELDARFEHFERNPETALTLDELKQR